jgi:hypothetical protein
MTSSRSLLLAGVVAAGMAGSAASAAAQRLESGPPRAEIGVTAAGIGGLIDLSEFEGDPQMGSWSAGPVLVFNPSRKIGLELSAEILRLDRAQVQFYELSVLVRRRLRDARSFAFWRFGAGGRHEFERVRERRRTNQDLSVTVYPAYEHHESKTPAFAIVGFGIERRLSGPVAIRAGLDTLIGNFGFGGRVSAGIVFGMGSVDRSR